jgi:hypothetical protein
VEDLRALGHPQATEEAPDAVVIKSNAGDLEIGVRLILRLIPQLHVTPASLAFRDTTEGTFQLENQGYGSLRIHLEPSESWITVNRQEWTIKGRKRARVRVRLVDAPENGQGTIRLRTPDTISTLPIQNETKDLSDARDPPDAVYPPDAVHPPDGT